MMRRALPILALVAAASLAACRDDASDGPVGTGDVPEPTGSVDSDVPPDTDGTPGTTGTTPPVEGWAYETVATAGEGRRLSEVGIAGHGEQSWLVWNDARLDSSDARTVLLAADGAERRMRDFGWRLRTDSSTNPAIATEPDSPYVYVGDLATCDDAWEIPCSGDPQARHFELLVVDKVTGSWTSEPADLAWPTLDHGRGDIAMRDGAVDACFGAHHPGVTGDEVVCNHRDDAGRWAGAVTVTGMEPGADDHATVDLRSDGSRVVGYVTTLDTDERRAAVSLGEVDGAPASRVFDDGGLFDKGEDTTVAWGPDGSVHAVWSEKVADGWRVQYGRCDLDDGAGGCAPLAAWELTELARGAKTDAPGVALLGTMPFATWTVEDRVQVAWICPDGAVTVEEVDPAPGEQTTNRGAPSLRVDEGEGVLHVVYTHSDAGGQVARWAQRPVPTCP